MTRLFAEAVACTREDTASSRYSKAFLSFKPASSSFGVGYMIGTYAHIKNKQAANQLLEQVAKLIEPLN